MNNSSKTFANIKTGNKMTYKQRLQLFCYWADFYGLKIIKGFDYDDESTDWAR